MPSATPTPSAITAHAVRFLLEPLHLTASWASWSSLVAVETHDSHVFECLCSNRQYASLSASAPFRLAQHARVIDPVPAAPKQCPWSGSVAGSRSCGRVLPSLEDADSAAVFCPACCDGDDSGPDADGEGLFDREDEATLLVPLGLRLLGLLGLLLGALPPLALLTALPSKFPAPSVSSDGESLLTTGSEDGPGVSEMEDVGAMRREEASVLSSTGAVATVSAGADDVVVSARAMAMVDWSAAGVWCWRQESGIGLWASRRGEESEIVSL